MLHDAASASIRKWKRNETKRTKSPVELARSRIRERGKMSWKPRRNKRNGETEQEGGADRWPWTIIAREVARIGLIVGKVGSRAVKGASPRGQGATKIGSGIGSRDGKHFSGRGCCSYARLLINLAYRVFGHELVCRLSPSPSPLLASCLSFDLTKVITNEFDIEARG